MHLRLQPYGCWFFAILVLLLASLAKFPLSSSLFSKLTSTCMDAIKDIEEMNDGNLEVKAVKTSKLETLPPLTDHEERQYDQFARKMSHYHNYLQGECMSGSSSCTD